MAKEKSCAVPSEARKKRSGMRLRWHERRAVWFGAVAASAGFLYALFAKLWDSGVGIDSNDIHLYLAPVLAGMAGMAIGRKQDRIWQQAALLDIAQKKFSALTRQAITERNWDVSFHDTHIPTCWEVKKCHASECPSFGKQHIRCWLVAGTYCRGEVQGRFAQKIGDCARCEVYQEAVEHDPLNKIGENFNSLMWVLRENEDLLSEAHQQLQSQYRELEILQARTREKADTDTLTGLRNHGHFQEYLKSEVETCLLDGRPLAVIMLDLDHFKSVNDEFGHQKGDDVLGVVGRMLSEEIRSADYAARYGGEEFVVVMPGVTGKAGVAMAEIFRQKLKEAAGEMGLSADYVGGSFGVADLPGCGIDARSLVAAADSALLFAKRQGRDRVAHFLDLSQTELAEGDIRRLHSRLRGASLETIRALAEAVNESDEYSGKESALLETLTQKLAEKLGMDDDQTQALELATKLHDIGKVGVPGAILRKKEKLTPEELAIVRRHPEFGHDILQEARQMQEMISAILYHHERWDGNGYPEHLQGEQIPVMARVVAIMDAYRAMRCDRPYRKALTVAQAIAELRRGAGTQFDPALVEVFAELLGEEGDERLRPAV